MQKLRYNKILCILIVTVICAMNLHIDINANSVFYITDTQVITQAESEALDAIESPKVEGAETSLFLRMGGNSMEGTGYYFNKKYYDGLTNKQKRECMRVFVKYLSDNPVNTADKQVLYNALKSLDDRFITSEISYMLSESKSGVFKALAILKPFQGVLGIIMGLLAIILMTGVALVTVVDLFFLGVPMFAVTESGEKPKLMSSDAFKALKQVQEENGNVYINYFKRRAATFILMTICIAYLLSGSIGDLFATVIDMFSSVTDLFGG